MPLLFGDLIETDDKHWHLLLLLLHIVNIVFSPVLSEGIRHIGPILHTWCMCYEAKHNFYKQQLKSFKNITTTLAKKHQSYMAMYHEFFSKERLILVPGKMVTLWVKSGCRDCCKIWNCIVYQSVFCQVDKIWYGVLSWLHYLYWGSMWDACIL